MVGRIEIINLEAKLLRAEILLYVERHRKGDPTQGVSRLSWHDAEEWLVELCQPLEVEVHLLLGVDEDDVEPSSPINEGLRKHGTLEDGLDD
jgi:hypothetical protein